MTHIFLVTFKFILIKNIGIMNLWLMCREKIAKNGLKTEFQNRSFLTIFSRLMSHKFMIHIFVIKMNLNVTTKIWVIINMTHES